MNTDSLLSFQYWDFCGCEERGGEEGGGIVTGGGALGGRRPRGRTSPVRLLAYSALGTNLCMDSWRCATLMGWTSRFGGPLKVLMIVSMDRPKYMLFH